MTLEELVRKRQSDRKYDTSKVVPREAIQRILETARLAPSATNSQPWHFIVIDDPDTIAKAAKCLTSNLVGKMNHFAATAPVLIAIVEEPANISGKAGNLLLNKHLPSYDIGIVASYITLAATNEGLGSCIMGWVNEPSIRKVLGIPKRKKVPLVIALGYSAQETREKSRKPLEKIYSYNSYKEDK